MTNDKAARGTGAGDEGALGTIRSSFLAGHFVHWPEEATTLGMHDHDDRLKDLSDAAIGDEVALHRSSRAALDELDQSAMTGDDKLDIVMMSALHEFHLHVVGDNEDHLFNIEMSLHPYLTLQLQQRVAHHADQWRAASARVSAIPRFLKQQQALLERGAAGGRTPDLDAVDFIATNQIPHIEQFFQTFAQVPAKAGVPLDDATTGRLHERSLAAAAAYSEHAAFLRDSICPQASVRTLGEDEYAWRLTTTLGVETGPAELIAQARTILQGLCEELMEGVAALNGGAVDSVQDALAFVMREKETPLTERDDDVISAYRALHERAKRHMRDHALFHFGDEVDTLGFVPPPAAFEEIAAATNVAAPLLDPNGSAYFLIRPDAAHHARIQAATLSVHEGIPGHSLQSIWWQTHRERRANLVRFLCVPDDMAFVRQYFGAMMNIEGWATYAEALMRASDFFEPHEVLWSIWCQIAHASRVVVDASLHCGRMNVPEAEAFLADEAGWPAAWAAAEVKRYRRLPLQSVCYLLGRLEIFELREQCRGQEGAAFSLADFHDRLFAAGPVAAGHLKKVWLS